MQIRYCMNLKHYIRVNTIEKKLLFLQKNLKNQDYLSTKNKKPNISLYHDKIVKLSFLNKLNNFSKKYFLNDFYGSSFHLNPHKILKEIKMKWKNIIWIININAHDSVNITVQKQMLTLLKKYINQSFIELISKWLEYQHFEVESKLNNNKKNLSTTKQDFYISSIISNLYFYFLDLFLTNNFLPKWNSKNEKIYYGEQINYKKITKATIKNTSVKKSLSILKNEINTRLLELKHSLTPKNIETHNFKRLYYTRYMNNFLFGYYGSKAEIILIKTKIEKILNPIKMESYIYHSSEKTIKYLGFYIKYVKKAERGNKFYKKFKNINLNQIQLKIPVKHILWNAIIKGYAKRRKNNESIRATSCKKLLHLEDRAIIEKFSLIIKKFVEYYSISSKYNELWQILSLYRKSCALTLANKHKLKTAAAIFKRYGPYLKLQNSVKNQKTILFYPISLNYTGNLKKK